MTLTQNGNFLVKARSYGLMENVSISSPYVYLKPMITSSAAGAGKSVVWYETLAIFRIHKLKLLGSSAVIEDIRELQKAGRASLAFFYCDFREDQKKDLRGLLTSLLVQLGEQSDAYQFLCGPWSRLATCKRQRITKLSERHAEVAGASCSSYHYRCPRRMSNNDWFATPSGESLEASTGARQFADS